MIEMCCYSRMKTSVIKTYGYDNKEYKYVTYTCEKCGRIFKNIEDFTKELEYW